jgi:hypothetical protein
MVAFWAVMQPALSVRGITAPPISMGSQTGATELHAEEAALAEQQAYRDVV